MRRVIQIPDGLNKKESALYRSLMRSPEKDIEKRWVYNNVKDIIGHKKTNSMNGEVKITFEYVPKESFKNEKSSLVTAEEELQKVKKSLDEKIKEVAKELENLKIKAEKADMAIEVLREIKGS